MTVEELKARLREDLKGAMRERALGRISLLRTLAAAIDNAEAVPIAGLEGPGSPLRATADLGEVARRALSPSDVAALLVRERDERLAAAETYARAGRPAEAARLKDESETVGAYL